MSDDENFEKTDAGSSNTEPVETQRLKKGDLVMIKDFPCKVTSTATAKPGKHGSAKVMLAGKDIFTNKTYECTFHSGDQVPAPIVKKTTYQCIDINDEGFLNLMDDNGEIREDCKLSEEEHLSDVNKRIKDILEAGAKECIVTLVAALGKEQI